MGIDDKGKTYPIEDLDKTLKKLTNTIRDAICRDAPFLSNMILSATKY